MAVTTEEFETEHGDTVKVTLLTGYGETDVFITVMDCDESTVPTARLSLSEAGEFRDALRRLCELGQQVGTRQR